MRLAMLATGSFAQPTFEALLGSRHSVVVLVTQPRRAEQGRRAPAANLLQVLAIEQKIPVLTPLSINTDEARRELSAFAPELLVVCDYGQILSPESLAVAPRGGINLHGSLLPKYRGAAPVQWAIYRGERETGVTVIHMTPRLDAGPALAVARTEIGPYETAPELESRLARLGAGLVVDAIDRLETGNEVAITQEHAEATRAPRLKKSDGALDWSRPAQALHDQVRALEPWPRTFTYWHRAGGTPLRLILGPTRAIATDESSRPGMVLIAHGDQLEIATGHGRLAIAAAQPEGKRMLPTEEFLRGYPLAEGDSLGPLAEESPL